MSEVDNNEEAVEVQLKYFQIEDIKKAIESGDRTNIPAQISFMIDQFDALNKMRSTELTEEEKDAQIGIAIYLWERSFDDGALQILRFIDEILAKDYKFEYDKSLPIFNTIYDPDITEEKFKPILDDFINTLTKTICKKISDNITNSELYKAINGLPLEEDTVIGTEKAE